MKVLILGAQARLGPHVIRALEPAHELRLTDIQPIETPHETLQTDVSVLADVLRATDGVDAIVNCSVLRPDRQLAFDVNTRGCYNIMQSAVKNGIQRVINTGPHFAVAGSTYEKFDYEMNPDMPPHPGTNLYALTKGIGQEICKIFTRNHDIYVLCMLFYNFREHDNLEGSRDHPFAVSWRDAAEAIRLGVEVDLGTLPSRCEIFNILTDQPHQQFRNDKAKRLLGFSPRDRLERIWHK